MVKQESLDATFGALADPTRRRLLQRLGRGEATVTELARPFDMSLPAVSKHLGVLERAGLLQRTRDGRVHRIRLEPEPLREAARYIEAYRMFWENSFDRLAAFLEETDPPAPKPRRARSRAKASTHPKNKKKKKGTS